MGLPEAGKGVIKSGRYCPVCEKVWDLSHDYCPDCQGVLLVQVRDYGDGFVIWKTEVFIPGVKKKIA